MGVSPVTSFLLSLHLLPLLLLILSILTAAPGPNSSPVFLHSNSPLSRKPSHQLTKPRAGSVLGWGHYRSFSTLTVCSAEQRPQSQVHSRVQMMSPRSCFPLCLSGYVFLCFFFFFVCGPILFLYNYAHCIWQEIWLLVALVLWITLKLMV